MQQAADAMRRAAGGSAAQGQAALEELNRAQKQLENAKSESVTNGIKQLADKAEQLERRQREIAEDVKRMQQQDGQQRGETARQIAEKKDALQRDVSQLEQATDRVARDGRREQPKAASQASAAASSIRENRIPEKITFSKRSMNQSSEYANAWENQIADNLGGRVNRAFGSAPASRSAFISSRYVVSWRSISWGCG
jgi:hypothetical protein